MSYKNESLRWSLAGFVFPQSDHYLLVVVLCTTFNILVYVIYQMTVIFLGLQYLLVPEVPKIILGIGWFIPINLFAIAVFVPVIEEIFFRGFLLREVMIKFNLFTSVVSTSLIFSFLHGDTGLFIPVFINSVVISVVYIRVRSLIPVIMIHALQNLVVTLVAASA